MGSPDRLVETGARHYGRMAARPASVSPLEEFSGPFRALRALRLKEWLGFTLLHPDWHSSLIMQDAHYLASSEIYAFRRDTGALSQHAATGRGGSLHLPARLLPGQCEFTRPGYRLHYDFAGPGSGDGQHRVRIDIDATASAPAFRGELWLDARRASAPLSVSARLPGGRLYTHKAVFPAAGELRVGADTVVFEPGRDLAILDEHRSLLPYRTSWLWGTFALTDGGQVAGANFAARAQSPGEEEESCIWAAGGCEPLDDISFTPHGGGPEAPWQIRSADGRLDVTFEPAGRKQVRHQLGIFSIDYFQLFGRYRGALRGGGRSYAVDGVPGVCESMRARL